MEAISIYILKSAGLLSLFYLVYILLLKNDTTFQLNRKFLILGIIAAFILPAAVFTKTIQVESQEVALENFIITEDFTGDISRPWQEEPLNAWHISGFIYLTGLSFFLIRFGIQLFSLFKIIKNQPKSRESGISILYTEEAIPPFSFFKFIILNPELHSPEELRIILQHEKIHAAQNHSADVLLANLTTALLWFNPLTWFYKKYLLQNLEFIADKETLAKNVSRKQYQETLIKVCLANQPALSNSFYQSFIKKRILMLHKKPTSDNVWKITAVIPLVLAFLLVFNVKTVAQVHTPEDKIELTGTEKYSVSISKNSSTEDLEFAKKLMLKQNLELEYEDVSRSPEGLLTSISINFLNITNNNSGSFSKNDPDGISSFVIFVNRNGETGVADAPVLSNEIKNSQDEAFAEIGSNPFFIVNGKEYQAAQLYGKSIRLKSGFVYISPIEAAEIKKYGTKGKDGIILVSEGEIIADLSEEMKRIDLENREITLNYLQIDQGSKPTFLRVNKNPEKPQTSRNERSVAPNGEAANAVAVLNTAKVEQDEKNKSESDKAKKVMAIGTGASSEADKPGIVTIPAGDPEYIYTYQKGSKSNPTPSVISQNQEKPLCILDEKIMEKEFDINSINPEEISSINVLKGEHAIKKYGKDAENGVIEITTKKAFLEKSPKIFVIKSSFSDAQLDGLKDAAKQQTNFKLNFKNIKRNSAGLISAIDVSLHGKDQKASASYKLEDGVPPIYVGQKKDGGVIVTSSPVK